MNVKRSSLGERRQKNYKNDDDNLQIRGVFMRGVGRVALHKPSTEFEGKQRGNGKKRENWQNVNYFPIFCIFEPEGRG